MSVNLQNISGYIDTWVLKSERPESIYVLLFLPTLKPVSYQVALKAPEMLVAYT